MADLWADRIKLNPKLDISTSVPGVGSVDGSLDSRSDTGGMNTRTISPSQIGPVSPAPKNPPATWSSGPDNNDYLAND